MDTGLPRFKVTDTTEEKVNAIQEYLYMFLEELRYYLQHLTEDNFTAEGAQALVSQAISGKEGQSAITRAVQEILALTESPRMASCEIDTAEGEVTYTVEGDKKEYSLTFVEDGDRVTYTWPDGFQCEVVII